MFDRTYIAVLSRFPHHSLGAVSAIVSLSAAIVLAVPPAANTKSETIATDSSKSAVVTQPDEGATQDAERAIARMKVPDGLKIELFAAEPLLENPVAFCFDERGRVYVAETHRVLDDRGVEDNRNHMDWLDSDLAAQTVEDRVAYIKKHRAKKLSEYTKYSEILRRIEDTDADGRADRATVFADGFNDIADGAAAGVLARNGDVYFTCIPHLWKLRDNDDDGRADERRSLHYGYGVKFAFFGHDLHGLTMGPDGRLYFSIGDRGFNVTTKEGNKLVNTDSGAVLRCELDGSNLEIFCIGLRNPQELVFDDYGNLFTCDNNSDSGDRARWIYLVEGADYGWRMHYQYLPDRGPWNREKLWHPQHEGQAAYIVPCITNITDGPSGVTYYPGTGLGDAYRGHFFVCDFRGSAAGSCIYTWAVKAKGASFELTGARKFLEGMLATDCDFGPDGGLYVSDWIDGWTGLSKGRIYRVVNPAAANDPRVKEVRKLLTEGFEKLPTDELVRLLAHPDRRVRLESQFELVKRKASRELMRVAKNGKDVFPRLHAIWGLGQVARAGALRDEEIRSFGDLLVEEDQRVLQEAVRVVGEAKLIALGDKLLKALDGVVDDQAVHSIINAFGHLRMRNAVNELSRLLFNFDEDPLLRHAITLALARIGDEDEIAGLATSKHVSDMMGSVLAMRQMASPEIVRFFEPNSEFEVDAFAVEAARAVHDLPIKDAMPQLAKVIDKRFSGNADQYDALFRRVLNANFRLGRASHAMALAKYAGQSDGPEHLRIEALDMLGQWAKPSPRDRVLGSWRPLGERGAGRAADALRTELASIFSGSAKIREKAADVAGKLGVKEVVPELVKLVSDEKFDAAVRVAALRGIAQLDASHVDEIVERMVTDSEPALRIGARQILAERNPAAALEILKQTLVEGTSAEKQAAYATLAGIANPQADELLVAGLGEMIAGGVAPEARLDLITAVRHRVAGDKRFGQTKTFDALGAKLQEYEDYLVKEGPPAAYRDTLIGGDATRGKTVFFEKVALSCLRCHKIGEAGGEVGPDLSKIGADKTREYLLEAITDPNKAIAKGFETVVVTLDDGLSKSGIVKSETERDLTLITAEGQTVIVPTATIEERTTGQSVMPADLVKQMRLMELRDLVEFLAQLR